MEMEKVLEEVCAIADKYNSQNYILTTVDVMKKYQGIVAHLYGKKGIKGDVEEQAIARLKAFYGAHARG